MHKLSERMRVAAGRIEDRPVSLRRIFSLHGQSAHGALLVLLSVPCMLPIPGTGTVLSFGIAFFAWMMLKDPRRLALPWRVARFQLPPKGARKTLGFLAWMYGHAERFSRPRLSVLSTPQQRWWKAPMIILMAVIIFLPLPLGNVLPAMSLVFLGMGMLFRDGVAVLLGILFALLACVFVSALGFAAIDIGRALSFN
jgi:hypothetical protein